MIFNAGGMAAGGSSAPIAPISSTFFNASVMQNSYKTVASANGQGHIDIAMEICKPDNALMKVVIDGKTVINGKNFTAGTGLDIYRWHENEGTYKQYRMQFRFNKSISVSFNPQSTQYYAEAWGIVYIEE